MLDFVKVWGYNKIMAYTTEQLKKLRQSCPPGVLTKISRVARAEVLAENSLPKLFKDRQKYITRNSLRFDICSVPKPAAILPQGIVKVHAEALRRTVTDLLEIRDKITPKQELPARPEIDPTFPKMEAI